MVPSAKKRKESKTINKRRKHIPNKKELRKSPLPKHKRRLRPHRPHGIKSSIVILNKIIIVKSYKI
jgi:hypothetical protein